MEKTSDLHTHSTSLINTVATSNKHENVSRKKLYPDSQKGVEDYIRRNEKGTIF